MSANILFIIIVTVFTLDFIFERYLSFLNIKNSKMPLPALLSGIYDNEKYAKQQSYFRANSRFGMAASGFSFLAVLLLLLFGGFGWLDGIVRSFGLPETVTTLVFFAILFLASSISNVPFEIYDIFVIEQRFGFNRVTPKVFILDKIKTCLLATLIGGGLVALIVYIYQLVPNYFWLLAFGVITLFGLLMSFFYSDIIVPLFNKQTPLPEGELRTEIEKFAQKAGFGLKNIYIIDGSKRSTKANAYFTGFGSKKRIVLYDTLLDKMTNEEIVAILSHEIGHYKNRHLLKSLLVALPSNLLLFTLLGIILKSKIFAQVLGCETPSFHINALSFAILYTPVSELLELVGNILSRKHEFEADNFAKSYGFAPALVNSLKKLSSASLSNLTPHPLSVFFNYSHPTLLQRVENLVGSSK
jgi:STE24 endopeptidase